LPCFGFLCLTHQFLICHQIKFPIVSVMPNWIFTCSFHINARFYFDILTSVLESEWQPIVPRLPSFPYRQVLLPNGFQFFKSFLVYITL
jgi:hypothetical protein